MVPPELENRLLDFLRQLCARPVPVTVEPIRYKAVELMSQGGLDLKKKLSVRQFMKLKGFALSWRTPICQKLPFFWFTPSRPKLQVVVTSATDQTEW